MSEKKSSVKNKKIVDGWHVSVMDDIVYVQEFG